jgi:hypothetical protein
MTEDVSAGCSKADIVRVFTSNLCVRTLGGSSLAVIIWLKA